MDRNYPAKNIPFEVVDTVGEKIDLTDDGYTSYEEILQEKAPVEVVDITPWEPHPALIWAGEALVLTGKGLGIAIVFAVTSAAAIAVFVLKHSGGILWALTLAVGRYVLDQMPDRTPWEDRDWDPSPSRPSAPSVNVETNVDVGPGGQVNITTNVRTR